MKIRKPIQTWGWVEEEHTTHHFMSGSIFNWICEDCGLMVVKKPEESGWGGKEELVELLVGEVVND